MKEANKTNVESTNSQITGKKKLVFNTIILFLSILFVFLLEFGLRVFDYGKDLTLFKESVNYPGHYEINKNATLRYFSKIENTSVTNDIFLIEKPDTCFRIFVFGGSTTRGFPYQEGTSFPRILYYRLQDAFPNKRIEIINLSASAINSYSYIDMANEVFNQKPDAILVYGGHNEYYGALGVGSVEKGGNARWLKKIRLKLGKLRTFQMVQNSIAHTLTMLENTKPSEATLMSRIVKDKDIAFNSPTYYAGIDQFEANLAELITKAKKNNVPIVLSDLVCNVSDLPPFKSVQQNGQESSSETYKFAQEHEHLQNYASAKELYYKAKDLDAVRFRAPEAFNEIIYKLGSEYNLPVVPMKKAFETNSPNQLIGDNLMLDHLHPTIDGYFLMADAFFNTLKENKLIDKTWDTSLIKPSPYYRNNWGFTELDSLIGDLNIKSLKSGWPFQPTNQPNIFLKTYKSTNTVDSMAFSYLTKKVRHIEDEHVKLAQFYAKYGLNNNAYKEYYSLIKMHPYIADLYYDASKYLINQHKYFEAINLIKSAPLMPQDYFYYYMMGTLQLKSGDTLQSIITLNYAYKLSPPETNTSKVLIPLYLAYKGVGDKENENKTVELIQKYNPDFKINLEPKGSVIKTKTSVDEIYNMSLTLIKQSNFSKAIEILIAADQFKEDFRIKKMLGAIYLKQKQYTLAYAFCNEAYEINPNDLELLNNLFVLYLTKNDLINSMDVLSRMESLNEKSEKIDRLKAMYEKKRVEIEMPYN